MMNVLEMGQPERETVTKEVEAVQKKGRKRRG